MQYTTLERLKEFLGIEDTSQDAVLSKLIARWSDMLTTELWDDLSLKTQTRRYDSFGTNRIVLEHVVNSIWKVEYTKNNWYSRTEVPLDFIDWYIVYLKNKIPKWNKNVRVTFTKWYDTVPQDIEAFFLKYVSKMRYEAQPNSDNKEIKTKKLDWLSITYFWPNELSSRDWWFAQDYEAIKMKYKVFSFPTT